MEKRINLKAYAKINLSLDVTGRREDGYHEVAMVMQAINLYDEVSVILKSKTGGAYDNDDNTCIEASYEASYGEINLHFQAGKDWNGDIEEIPCDGRNTAYKAAEIMLEEFQRFRSFDAETRAETRRTEAANADEGAGISTRGNAAVYTDLETGDKADICIGADNKADTDIETCDKSDVDIEINIVKNIPMAAGLAGGSADAAGVIMALNKMLGLDFSLTRLCELAVRVGADVPFCIMAVAAVYGKELGIGGGTTCALAEGIGEVLTPLRSVKFDVILAKPPVSVSTKTIYTMLDSTQINRHPNNAKLIKGLDTGSFGLIKESMYNVLEPVTFDIVPQSETLKEQMSGRASFAVMMSGSGPTVFSLYTDRKSAIAAEKNLRKLKEEGYSVILTETL